MFHPMRRSRSERGVSAVEYAVIIALISVVIIAPVAFMGDSIKQAFCDAAKGLNASALCEGTPSEPDGDEVCDAGGAYTGDYTEAGLYWTKVEEFENGQLWHSAGGDQWTGNDYYFEESQRGAQIGDPERSADDDATITHYEHGNLVEYDFGWTNWEGESGQYDQQDAGNLITSYWNIDNTADYGGTTMASPPEDGLARIFSTGSSPCSAPFDDSTDCSPDDGSYTGSYTNWYWLKIETYEHGKLFYYRDGNQWVSVEDTEGHEATLDEKGEMNSQEVVRTNIVDYTPAPWSDLFDHHTEWYTNGTLMYYTWADSGELYGEIWWNPRTVYTTWGEDQKGNLIKTDWLGGPNDNGGFWTKTAPAGAVASATDGDEDGGLDSPCSSSGGPG